MKIYAWPRRTPDVHSAETPWYITEAMQTHGSPPLPPFLFGSIASQHCSIILPTTLALHDFSTLSPETHGTMSNPPQIAGIVQFDCFLPVSDQITQYSYTFSGFSVKICIFSSNLDNFTCFARFFIFFNEFDGFSSNSNIFESSFVNLN